MDFNNGTSRTLVIVYGPNEDELESIKDAFWNELTWITENLKGSWEILTVGWEKGLIQ